MSEPRYSILIRHNSWIDQYARRIPVPRFGKGVESIDTWISESNPEDFGEDELDQVEAHRQMLQERFGSEGYRFSVIERRMVPRWFLLNPEKN